MDSIFHERQEGSLCAQHCLNSLLQGPYFSAVDLADIGRELDEAERATMAEGDVNSPEYLRFIQQPSSNMDDSGYFSVQVIGRALKVWGLELVPFGSTEAVDANIHPERERSFICNFKDHWLTIRKLGQQWFNLNSLLTGPELISDTYLGMFLVQLQKEGYSIFVVRGSLPDNEADQLLNFVPAVQTAKPTLMVDLSQQQDTRASTSSSSSRAGPTGKKVVSLEDLHSALQGSLPGGMEGSSGERLGAPITKENSQELADAIMQGLAESSDVKEVDVEEIRRKRRAFFERQQTAGIPEQHVLFNRPASSDPSRAAAPGEGRTLLSAAHQLQGLPVVSDVSLSGSEQTNSEPTQGAIGKVSDVGMGVEQYTNDEQMTEETMLEMAIQMSLAGTKHQQQHQQQQGSGS